MTIPEQEILKTKILKTYVNGEAIFSAIE